MPIAHAWAARAPGGALKPFSYEIAPESPPPGHVDVVVTHCGICHSDLHQIDDAWNVARFPLVPGHEIVGRVAAAGDDDDLQVGERVAIGVQRGCCERCTPCAAGMENLCPGIRKTYGPEHGGFSTMIRFPRAWVFRPPDALHSRHVAPLMCAGITTYAPLRRFGKPGMRVGVVGIGGLGHLAIQFARAMEFSEVAALSTRADKREEALRLGATHFVHTEAGDAMRALRHHFDMLLVTASQHTALDAYLQLLAPRGVLSYVGLPDMAHKSQFHPQSVVQRECSIVGSYLGGKAQYDEMLAFAAVHGVEPWVETFAATQVNEAIERLRHGRARYRVVLDLTTSPSGAVDA